MSERLFSCSIALLIAGTSALLLWLGLGRLTLETNRNNLKVGALTLGDNHFSLRPRSEQPGPCLGSFTITVRDDGNHLSILLKGWVSVAFSGKHWFQDLRGELSFNPLAQLGASIIEIPVGNDTIKLGTKNINPLTLIAFRSTKETTPTFSQEIPGPIELHQEGKLFHLVGPIPFDTGLRSNLTPLLSSIPLEIMRDSGRTCSQAESSPLDLTATINILGTIHSRFSHSFPLRIP